ncbi:hypothetical protein [Streptomyces sp. NPDC003006]
MPGEDVGTVKDAGGYGVMNGTQHGLRDTAVSAPGENAGERTQETYKYGEVLGL